MKKRLFRHYHSFYTSNNSLDENNQEQNSTGVFPPLDLAPDAHCPYLIECKQDMREICSGDYNRCTIYSKFKILSKLKSKTGLERFTERYPNYQEMFVGSKK